jgi:hypothetical protein
MQKPDFPALLKPGIHPLTIEALHGLAVAPFPQDSRRAELYEKLKLWVITLRASGVRGRLWLDGSFLTEKIGPSDIDCIFWSPSWVDEKNATQQVKAQVGKLLDRAYAETIFSLDFYMETPAPDRVLHREAYWRGMLGFCHDRVTAKGFAEITL